eukprot:1460622-Prymnesium_polylepis.1
MWRGRSALSLCPRAPQPTVQVARASVRVACTGPAEDRCFCLFYFFFLTFRVSPPGGRAAAARARARARLQRAVNVQRERVGGGVAQHGAARAHAH